LALGVANVTLLTVQVHVRIAGTGCIAGMGQERGVGGGYRSCDLLCRVFSGGRFRAGLRYGRTGCETNGGDRYNMEEQVPGHWKMRG
jgi:hypothetical protein